jgi:cytochrome c oxidase cbb3-type subunit 3
MKFGILLIATAAATLVTAACNTTPNSVAAASEAPIPTTVGPVPGGISEVKPRMNPYTGNPVALQEGLRLFNWYNCSGCHGGHAGGGMGPSLRDAVWIYGNRDDQIFDSIAQGRSKGMPAWGTKIPEDQIWHLVAYIKSMRTPEEPEPPVEPADENVGGPAGSIPNAPNTPVEKDPQSH